MRTLFGTLNFMYRASLSPFLTQECKLEKRTELTTNVTNPVILLRFALPSKNDTLGNDVFNHVSITAYINNERVRRNYTPISCNTEKGYFEIIVKVYPNGLMGNYLKNLKIGESVIVTPPRGKLVFDKNSHSHIGIIAGGVGIAPFISMLQQVLDSSNTRVTLLYANQTENDIILLNTLREWAQQYATKFTLHLILSQPHTEWTGLRGHVNEDIIRDCMPSDFDKSLILLCGPKPMNKKIKSFMATINHSSFYKV